MDIQTAKQAVIDAGKKLVETGLIARTWGNVSCRIDADSFVITPSGKAYDGLTPADIVQVKLADTSYEGEVKPSSEKGVHAEVYKARADINFVIHTHQNKASVLSALSGGIPQPGAAYAEILGGAVPLGAYGLPGTGKLKKGVAAAIAQTKGKAVIMAHHGALCYGTDAADAFLVASTLEEACDAFLKQRYQKKYGSAPVSEAEYVRSITGTNVTAAAVQYSAFCQSDRKTFLLRGTDGSEIICSCAEKKSGEPTIAACYREILHARADISVILAAATPATLGVSAMGNALRPQLDDFAQIIGASMNCANALDAAVVKALKGRHAVLLKGQGALCAGKNESDARAVEMIAEKGCQTLLGSLLCGENQYISGLESRLMRFIYLKKYSKQE